MPLWLNQFDPRVATQTKVGSTLILKSILCLSIGVEPK